MRHASTKRRLVRLAVGTFLPCPIAFLLLLLSWAIADRDPRALLLFPFMLLLVYVVMGVQSLGYSLIMEFCVWRVFGVNGLAVAVSTLLGTLCGMSLRGLPDMRGVFIGLGCLTGLTTGLALYRLKKIESARSLATVEHQSDATQPAV